MVLYTCATRKMRKKGSFFEAKRDSCESRLGVKMCLFVRKRVLLDSFTGRLGVNFQTLPKMFPQKSLFRCKFESKTTRNSCLGVFFPGEGKSRLGFVLKTSGHTCVQHLYSSGPRGTYCKTKLPHFLIQLALCSVFTFLSYL